MKVLVTKDSLGYVAELMEYAGYASGKTFDDCVYNLQAMLARMVIDAVADNVFGESFMMLEPEQWASARPTFYDRASFYYEGKPVLVPVLDIRVTHE